MPFYTLFNDVDYFDQVAFQADSYQLEAFRSMDFATAMDDEIAKVIKGSDNIHLRYLPLIWRICTDKARHYVKRPTRSFKGGSVAQSSKLEELYSRSRVDRFMLEAQQKSVGQNSVIITVEPTKDPRKLRFMSWIPAEVEIEAGDLLETDLRNMKKLTLKTPVAQSGNSVYYGRRVYTADEAYVEHNGKRVGIFNEQGTNPLGYIPATMVRLIEPSKGFVFPQLPLDLLSIQIGLIVGMSDIENIVRLKAMGREVVTGDNAKFEASKMSASPHGIFALNGDVSYQAASIDPRIDRYLQAIETTLKLLANFRYLSPDAVWTSNTGRAAATGAAKMVERADMMEDKQRTETLWQDVEQDVVELVADMGRVGPSALAVKRPEVRVNYHYLEPMVNDLQNAQAAALRYSLGLSSAIEDVAVREGVRREEAADMIEDRLKQYQDAINAWRTPEGSIQAPAGIDSIAASMLQGRS
tara:strand:- start:689 stop:2095 length:1407 start_codon:yes stop_codon:yes gene_type:complete